MTKTIFFLLLWLGFLSYGFILAPPDDPNNADLIEKLASLETEEINPIIVSLFNLMGILPLMYAPLLLIDGKEQRLLAWPFILLSFAVGAFALLPYLAFREPKTEFSYSYNWLLRGLNSRSFGVLTVGAFLLILIPGVTTGNWSDFFVQWQNNRFIHVMSLDFCLLILLFPVLLREDLARRGVNDSRFFQTLIWIPLLGSFLYFVVRPPLIQLKPAMANQQQSPVNQT